jgi:hypothetical protein
MKKNILLLCALFGLMLNASAMPVGWYQLDETWRDGSFSGQIYYDSASPFKIAHVSGVLTDLAHTTLITSVWNLQHDASEAPATFLYNALTGDVDSYDTGFYIKLVDLGSALAIDLASENRLFDFSNNALFNEGQLDGSPLISWRINAVEAAHIVPEPAGMALLSVGILAFGIARRRISLGGGQQY